MQPLLTSEQRTQMQSIAVGDAPVVLRRRALLLLLYDEGRKTSEVAESVGLSRTTTRRWRRQFLQHGIAIFPTGILENAPSPADLPVDEAPETAAVSPPDPMQTRNPSLEEFAATAGELLTPGVLPEDGLADAGRKVWLYQLAQMLANNEGTRLGADIEALHDMRVATRRMRAAFDVFGEAFEAKALKPHLRGLRATGRALGPARDLDVFLEKAHAYESTLPADEQDGLQPLLDAWQEQRRIARENMVTYLDGENFHRFCVKFYRFLCNPTAGLRKLPTGQPQAQRIRDVAPQPIYTRLAAVRAFDAILENATIEQFHSLRIEFKKFRYSVEFFREVLGPESKFVVNEIKVMQDHLGNLNDAQVATHILGKFLETWDTSQAHLAVAQRRSPEPLIAYLTYQYRERHQLMHTFHTALERFNQPVFRQNLAAAVGTL
jgi:CHAD domain-containing protein/transposase-like protein